MTESQRIVLDRTHLLRLAEVMAGTKMPENTPEAYRRGWQAAVQSLHRMAEEMPHIYGDSLLR